MTKGPWPMLVTKLASRSFLTTHTTKGPMANARQQSGTSTGQEPHVRDSTMHTHSHWAGRLTNRGSLTQEWDQDQVRFSKCSKANWFYLLSPAFSSTPALCTLFNKLIPKSTLQRITYTVTVQRTP